MRRTRSPVTTYFMLGAAPDEYIAAVLARIVDLREPARRRYRVREPFRKSAFVINSPGAGTAVREACDGDCRPDPRNNANCKAFEIGDAGLEQRGEHNTAGGDPEPDQHADLQGTEDQGEIGSVESAHAVFGNDDVAGRGPQRRVNGARFALEQPLPFGKISPRAKTCCDRRSRKPGEADLNKITGVRARRAARRLFL